MTLCNLRSCRCIVFHFKGREFIIGFNRPAAQSVKKTTHAWGKVVHACNLGKVGQEHGEFKANLSYTEKASQK